MMNLPNVNSSNMIAAHEQVLHFPKDSKPSLAPNDWIILNSNADEGMSLDGLETRKVIVPFAWWIQRHNESDVITKAKQGAIAVWFSADDDILKYADLIEQGKAVWPLVAAHFPIFRDGRSFSTAALLRDRFQWAGEIRAIGDVLIDQLLQGARVGFDSFSLRPGQKTDIALKQFDLFSVTTQNSWRGKRTALQAS